MPNSFLYGLPQKYEKLISSTGAWNKPAIAYPASVIQFTTSHALKTPKIYSPVYVYKPNMDAEI